MSTPASLDAEQTGLGLEALAYVEAVGYRSAEAKAAIVAAHRDDPEPLLTWLADLVINALKNPPSAACCSAHKVQALREAILRQSVPESGGPR